VAGSLGAQVRQHGLADPQRTEEVDLELGSRLRLGELLEHAHGHGAGIVDDDVEPAEVLDRGGYGGGDRLPVGHVER
jgi:hypothetical protein